MKKLRTPGEAESIAAFLEKINVPFDKDRGEEQLEAWKGEYDIDINQQGVVKYKPISTQEKRRRQKIKNQKLRQERRELEKMRAYNKAVSDGNIIPRKCGDINLKDHSKFEKANIDCLVLCALLKRTDTYAPNETLFTNMSNLIDAIFSSMPIMNKKNEKKDKTVYDTKTQAFDKLNKYIFRYQYDIIERSLNRLKSNKIIKFEKLFVAKNKSEYKEEFVKPYEDIVLKEHFSECNKYAIMQSPKLKSEFYDLINSKLKEDGYAEIDYSTLKVTLLRDSFCYNELLIWLERGNNFMALTVNIYEIIKYHFLKYAKEVFISPYGRRKGFDVQLTERIRNELLDYIKENMIYKDIECIHSLDEMEHCEEIFNYDMYESFNTIEQSLFFLEE